MGEISMIMVDDSPVVIMTECKRTNTRDIFKRRHSHADIFFAPFYSTRVGMLKS
jgi:hypothetical protein